jgi:hypothetical protein
MSAGNPEGFPWGANCPTRRQRYLFALIMGIASALWWFQWYYGYPHHGVISDFDIVWQAATGLLNGGDPYVLMGPEKVFHLDYPVIYPATAFVVAIPFTLLPQAWASFTFVFLSTFLMAYGMTADGWHRIPIFASLSFLTSALLGQWSMLMTAILFLPWLAIFSSVKPQATVPIAAASESPATPIAAIAGTVVLMTISLVMLPRWPIEWWHAIWSSPHVTAPITRIGGFAVLLVLLRWRRPEAWLVLLLACVPQTSYPYNVLMLLALARTWREATILTAVSSLGALPELRANVHDLPSLVRMGHLMVISGYLPATVMILRRPNEGVGPWWMQLVAAVRQRRTAELSPAAEKRSVASG